MYTYKYGKKNTFRNIKSSSKEWMHWILHVYSVSVKTSYLNDAFMATHRFQIIPKPKTFMTSKVKRKS